jgi:hypothetical protein
LVLGSQGSILTVLQLYGDKKVWNTENMVYFLPVVCRRLMMLVWKQISGIQVKCKKREDNKDNGRYKSKF